MSQLTASGGTPALIHRALRCCEVFRDWPDHAVDDIVRSAQLERYVHRTQVLGQGRQRRDVVVVVSGCLEVSGMNMLGGKFILAMLRPGEVAGLVRLLKGGDTAYDYHAHESTVLVRLPGDGLRGILDGTPLLWRDVALFALKRQHDSITSLRSRALSTLPQILAETLVKLVDWYGQPIGGGTGIHLRVSQSDLASMVSVSRQTINKELRLLAQKGVLTADYASLTILDLPALRCITEGTRKASD